MRDQKESKVQKVDLSIGGGNTSGGGTNEFLSLETLNGMTDNFPKKIKVDKQNDLWGENSVTGLTSIPVDIISRIDFRYSKDELKELLISSYKEITDIEIRQNGLYAVLDKELLVKEVTHNYVHEMNASTGKKIIDDTKIDPSLMALTSPENKTSQAYEGKVVLVLSYDRIINNILIPLTVSPQRKPVNWDYLMVGNALVEGEYMYFPITIQHVGPDSRNPRTCDTMRFRLKNFVGVNLSMSQDRFITIAEERLKEAKEGTSVMFIKASEVVESSGSMSANIKESIGLGNGDAPALMTIPVVVYGRTTYKREKYGIPALDLATGGLPAVPQDEEIKNVKAIFGDITDPLLNLFPPIGGNNVLLPNLIKLCQKVLFTYITPEIKTAIKTTGNDIAVVFNI